MEEVRKGMIHNSEKCELYCHKWVRFQLGFIGCLILLFPALKLEFYVPSKKKKKKFMFGLWICHQVICNFFMSSQDL